MDKVKLTLYIQPETMEKVEQFYKEDCCTTKSDYIEKAINFYSGYIASDKYSDYLPKIILSTVGAKFDALGNRMASLIFKTAVELDMMLHVTAATNEIDESTLSGLRGMCVEEVKRLQGTISLDNALRFQKG